MKITAHDRATRPGPCRLIVVELDDGTTSIVNGLHGDDATRDAFEARMRAAIEAHPALAEELVRARADIRVGGARGDEAFGQTLARTQRAYSAFAAVAGLPVT